MKKIDYKKEYKNLYQPGRCPVLIQVPVMNFIMVDGTGEPQGASYQAAMQILYALSFTIKMSKLKKAPEGYFEYVVPPLEGLWWSPEGKLDLSQPKSKWCWTSMIRQPEFVTEQVYQEALEQCRLKKTDLDFSAARFESFEEGWCVQLLHTGPYDQELESIRKIGEFIGQNGLIDRSGNLYKHHEIYLSDPRRTAPERLKTILRIPVEKKSF